MSELITVFHGRIEKPNDLLSHYISRGQAFLLHAYLVSIPTANLTTSFDEAKGMTGGKGSVLEFHIPSNNLIEIDKPSIPGPETSSWYVSSSNLRDHHMFKWASAVYLRQILPGLIANQTEEMIANPSLLPNDLIISYVDYSYFKKRHRINTW